MSAPLPTALQTGDAHLQACLLQRAVEAAHGKQGSAVTRLLRRQPVTRQPLIVDDDLQRLE
jgi:hypothetical protein